MNFYVPADYRVKLKESKKKDKYIDLARKWKMEWNMKVTIEKLPGDLRRLAVIQTLVTNHQIN